MLFRSGQGEEFVVRKGERVAQLLFAQVPTVKFMEMNYHELGITDRGVGGFGSSGEF